MKKLIILIFGLVISFLSHGQQLNESDINKLNGMVFESLSKENFIKMNRVTTEGSLSSCELEFQYTYRDTRQLQGKPVMVVGSFTTMYFKGKNLGYFFKIVPMVSDVKTQKWNYQSPSYSDLFINNQGIEKYKTLDFNCDKQGKCRGYEDKSLNFTKLVLSPNPFDGEIKFSLVKGGSDNTFKLSTLLPKRESEIEREKFTQCTLEVLEKIVKDLEKIK